MNFLTVLLTKCLKENHIEMYSACNEGKYVVADRFIRTFQQQQKDL